ncbi:unnamed protein product [Prorocentrum cordatum]|uniref:Guanylate cyclase n=1 Tax=Prorocentrum cordatum TaxID=2364126 RepID=A0ABN9VHA3_9DINO|nr:unnamed protein product [Polarella glacialis]
MGSVADRVVLVCSVISLGLYVVAVSLRWGRLGASGLRDVILSCWRRARGMDQLSADACVAKLMDKKRGEMVRVTSSVCQGFLFIAILWGIVNTASNKSRLRNTPQDGILVVTFGLQALASCDHDLGFGYVNQTLFVYVVAMLGCTAIVITTTGGEAMVAVNAFMLCPRITFSLAYMNSGMVCLSCVFHAVASSLTYSYQMADTQSASTHPQASQIEAISNMSQTVYTSADVMCCLIVILSTFAWEMTMALHARNELEVVAKRGETTATRRLLNTFCDALFELDAGLRIADDALQLAVSLQHGASRSLRGMLAESLMVAEDRALFREFVTTPVLASQSMANVLHVRMRDSLNNILRVELFHVPVDSSLTGASHLIGVREHADYGDYSFQQLPVWPMEAEARRGRCPPGPEAAPRAAAARKPPGGPPRGHAPPAARLGTPAVAACESSAGARMAGALAARGARPALGRPASRQAAGGGRPRRGSSDPPAHQRPGRPAVPARGRHLAAAVREVRPGLPHRCRVLRHVLGALLCWHQVHYVRPRAAGLVRSPQRGRHLSEPHSPLQAWRDLQMSVNPFFRASWRNAGGLMRACSGQE